MICNKPRFPDTMRDEVGSYGVSIAANGQCFSPPTVNFSIIIKVVTLVTMSMKTMSMTHVTM